MRAGLIPLLRSGALEGSEHWRYVTLKPGTRPLDMLATEFTKLQGSDLDLALRLSHSLAESERALLLAADMLLDRANGERLVLFIDQFEEIWTQAPAEACDAFVRLLLTAADAPDAPLLVVLAMRADFLHRAIEYRPLAERIERHVALVSPMQPDELRAAILRPAEGAGGGFEPGLVEELVTQVQDRPGALPLLEYTLLELWKRRAPDGTMTWADYRALGGVEGALAARADAILNERYTIEQQAELRQLLLRLVQPDEGSADTHRRVRLADLVPAGMSLEAVQLLLQPLVDARLLVTTGEGSGVRGQKYKVRKQRTTDRTLLLKSRTKRLFAPGQRLAVGLPMLAPICGFSFNLKMRVRNGARRAATKNCCGAVCAWPRPTPGSSAPGHA